MVGREPALNKRKTVSYRLMEAQLEKLETIAKVIGKSKTDVVEQALAYYFNVLHRDGVI